MTRKLFADNIPSPNAYRAWPAEGVPGREPVGIGDIGRLNDLDLRRRKDFEARQNMLDGVEDLEALVNRDLRIAVAESESSKLRAGPCCSTGRQRDRRPRHCPKSQNALLYRAAIQ